jgi:proteasome alpha subunit
MSYSFYDWNNALQQRNEYVEDRLKDGSPIVAVSYNDGILLLTLRGAQRKVFEVYDRLMMAALGKQSDIESLRLAAIDSAHREGFERSPDDVSLQRMVGFGLSPAIKRVYNDQSAIPLTVRAVFAELGRSPDKDTLFVVGFDGEYKAMEGIAVAAGTAYAEEQAESSLRESAPTPPATLDEALQAALKAWGVGRSRLAPKREEDEEFDPLSDSDAPKVADDPTVAVREALKNGSIVEAGILSRSGRGDSRFRLLRASEVDPLLEPYK